MENIKPCPYCGGEVELVKLNRKKKTDPEMFRVECRRCHALVAKGRGFNCETFAEAEERVRQYKEQMKKIFPSIGFGQSITAKSRDNMSRNAHKSGC